jgi:hypothetical protein
MCPVNELGADVSTAARAWGEKVDTPDMVVSDRIAYIKQFFDVCPSTIV